jgi:Uma2 family endonuclease
MPVENPLVSVEEYLRTSYRPDCDYVDGRIEERNLGELEHSILQTFLTYLFFHQRREWGIEVFSELRAKVSGTRFRVPDILVVRRGTLIARVLDQPPLIAIEILSPEDRLSRLHQRIMDYLTFGVEHIWVFDPEERVAWRATGTGLHVVADGELTVPGTPIRVVLSEVFAELDRA